jgi:hypothetical protein
MLVDLSISLLEENKHLKADKEALIAGQETLQKAYEALKADEEREHQYCKNVCEPKHKAEIKELNTIRSRLINDGGTYTKITDELYQKIKAKAIKEFALRLKSLVHHTIFSSVYGVMLSISENDFDNLVKEMVGDKE